MNSTLVLLLSGFVFLSTNLGLNMGDKPDSELKWTSFTQGVKEAEATNKKVLVDVFTDWCSLCKKMDSDTYTHPRVKDYLSKNYVLVKLNAESDAKETLDTTKVTDAQLASAFGVNGYPTTIFLESTGHPITMAPGFMKPDEFLHVLKYIGDDVYKRMEFKDYLKSLGVPAK